MAEADTFVNAAEPKRSRAAATVLRAGLEPKRVALLRFPLAGIAGTIESASLRLYSRRASPQGGKVIAMSETSWSENVTWSTRPSFAGQSAGSFGPVGVGVERLAIPSSLLGGSELSLAVKVNRAKAPLWASSESDRPPKLVITTTAEEIEGLSTVAGPEIGSSDPTWFASNQRAALTDEGRMLVLHGKHATGVQLAWRDPGGDWNTKTTGRVSSGLLHAGGGTGDWTASIVVGTDSQGVEHAWVVWGGWSATDDRQMALSRLNKIDSGNGPQVGPVVPLAPAGDDDMGTKVDIALEPKSTGGFRGVVSWQRQTEAISQNDPSMGEWELVTKWFTDLDSDTPTFHDEHVLFTSTGSTGFSRVATLTPGPDGVHAAVRNNDGKLALYSHDADATLTSWSSAASNTAIASTSRPSAVTLDSGDVVAAVVSSSTTKTVSVVNWDAHGTGWGSTVTTQGDHPSLATNGSNVWVVMVDPIDDPAQTTDGSVFSQTFDPASLAMGARVQEISASQCGRPSSPEMGDPPGCEWPNTVRRTDDRLRFIVKGPEHDVDQSAVLAFQRSL
ncbi:MAG: hypothetical protein M3285_06660 [Actinomycetota bacterium]|nr:hypothetical protein [Actinomycetota bacterium]